MGEMSSVEELHTFLRLYGIEEDPEELRKIWDSTRAPIIVDESKPAVEKNKIFQIVHVWEKDNIRYALRNDRRVGIFAPEDPVYNYIDGGRHVYRWIFLLFEPTQDLVGDIREYWGAVEESKENSGLRELGNFNDRHYLYYMQHMNPADFTLSLHEFKQMIEHRRKYGCTEYISPDDAQRGLEHLVSSLRQSGVDIELGEEFIRAGELRYGVEGQKLRDYVVFDSRWYGLPYPGMRFRAEHVLSAFYNGLSYRLEGEHVVWLGRFSIRFKAVKNGSHLYRYMEGKKFSRHDVRSLAADASRYSDRESFLKNLQKFKERKKAKAGELAIPVEDSNGMLLQLRFEIKRVEGKRGLVSPLTGELFHLPRDSWHKLKRLSMSSSRAGLFQVFRLLSEHIPEERLLQIIYRAREDAKLAEERSKKLLDETLRKYPDRIREGTFDEGDRGHVMHMRNGYIVKGEKRNYFIGEKGAMIYTYPEGCYVCIVDEEEGRMLPSHDRLVSRMLLLMNDSRLESDVPTLMDEDELRLIAREEVRT